MFLSLNDNNNFTLYNKKNMTVELDPMFHDFVCEC